jgi:hypothetical protein
MKIKKKKTHEKITSDEVKKGKKKEEKILPEIELTKTEAPKETETENEKPKHESTDELLNSFLKNKSEFDEKDFVEERPNEKQNKTHKVEKVEEGENSVGEEGAQAIEIKSYELKKHLVLKVGNFLFTGFHLFIFNAISKTKITYDELKLSDEELESLEEYVSEEIIRLLDIIPDWLFPIIHIEFMYIEKWQDIIIEKKKLEENEKKKNIK